jgi:hypothetical protein
VTPIRPLPVAAPAAARPLVAAAPLLQASPNPAPRPQAVAQASGLNPAPSRADTTRQAALDQREQAIQQRERELAEQRRILAEEYRLLRSQRAPAASAPAAVKVQLPGSARAVPTRFAVPAHEGWWARLKRAMFGVSTAAAD